MQRSIWIVLLAGLMGACDVGWFSSEVVYVTPGVLNMRSGPSTRDKVIRRLERGLELTVLARQEKWVRLRLEDGVEGWVHGDYVGTVADVRARFEQDLSRRRSVPRGTTTTVGPSGNTGPTIGRAIDSMVSGMPVPLAIERLDPLDGTDRRMGVAAEGQLVAEFWGDPRDLERAMLMVKVLEVGEEDLVRNSAAAHAFVTNAMPGLEKDVEWMSQRLQELSSGDVGEGALKTTRREVTFHFLKALGTVRITVEVPTA